MNHQQAIDALLRLFDADGFLKRNRTEDRELVRKIRQGTCDTGIMMSPSEMILTQDANSLIGLVMRLTGGSANPAVIGAHIERIRTEARTRQHFTTTEQQNT